MITFLSLIVLLSTVLSAQSNFTYPSCNGSLDWNNDFKKTRLIEGLDEPIKMDFYDNPQGEITLYYVERGGLIYALDLKSDELLEVGRPPDAMVDPGKEDGLTGIALDPDFENTKWPSDLNKKYK